METSKTDLTTPAACDLIGQEPDRDRLGGLRRETEPLERFREKLRGVRIWDMHAHVGRDHDGSVLDPAELVARMEMLGVEKTVVFPMDDPRQGECFTHPNDVVWEAYRAFPERIIPFFRLNPNYPSRDEYAHRLEQGFQGIKLHPRSQSFSISQPEAMRIYGWAERDGIPILIHTGRGIENVVRDIRHVADQHPALRLVLGHSAAYELKECCARCESCDWLLFDTSSIGKERLRSLLQIADPHKIVYGSDVPFDPHAEDLLHLLELAEELEIPQDELELILGGNLRRWMEEGPVCRYSCPLDFAQGA